jgi:Zn-dependent M28 family amino/carboxypeptidase
VRFSFVAYKVPNHQARRVRQSLLPLAAGLVLLFAASPAGAQEPPPSFDPRLYDIVEAVSAERIESDVRRLAGFGTRHTRSDTTSEERGIGAARRWVKREFEGISEDCGGCLAVSYQDTLVPAEGNDRFDEDTRVVNVLAVQRGSVHPNRYVVISGDIDSRASDIMNDTIDAPGANDNATGVAGALEAARVLSQYEFGSSIIYAGLSGEEQGLYGGEKMASVVRQRDWNIAAVFNNDMIGNIQGQDGVVDNTVFRVFSQPFRSTASERELRLKRYFGGEVDGPSRQLARYVASITDQYVRNLDAMMIYRLDRFGRGGHHTPFNDEGFPAVRIMEAHEDYRRQHQNVRTEGDTEYGDVASEVEFRYARKTTAVNAATLAALAWAPPRPQSVRIGGAVEPSATLAWEAAGDPDLAGYKLYWRKTTAPRWTNSRFVGPGVTRHTLENIIIDNYYFGVAAVGENGNESPVVFPGGLLRD